MFKLSHSINGNFQTVLNGVSGLFRDGEQPKCVGTAVAGNCRTDRKRDDFFKVMDRVNLFDKAVEQRFVLHGMRYHDQVRLHLLMLCQCCVDIVAQAALVGAHILLSDDKLAFADVDALTNLQRARTEERER